MSDAEKKRQEAINKIIYMERDFIRDMEYLRDFHPFVSWGAQQLYGKYEFEEKRSNPAFARFVEVSAIRDLSVCKLTCREDASCDRIHGGHIEDAGCITGISRMQDALRGMHCGGILRMHLKPPIRLDSYSLHVRYTTDCTR